MMIVKPGQTHKFPKTTKNLKPCPFCGKSGKNLEVIYEDPDFIDSGRRVVCIECPTSGPLVDDCETDEMNMEEAMKAWNGRKEV